MVDLTHVVAVEIAYTLATKPADMLAVLVVEVVSTTAVRPAAQAVYRRSS
jgi:hypothetical protein